MAANHIDQQSSSPRVRSFHADNPLSSAFIALSPAVSVLVAWSIHQFHPNARLPPMTWLDTVPSWRHPYPILLFALLVFSLLGAAAQAVLPYLRTSISHYSPLLASAIAIASAWELATSKMNWLHQPFFPAPDEILGAMIDDRRILFESAWHSLQLLLTGYFAGVFAGIASGVLIGWFKQVRYWAMPALKLIGPVPATALVPLVMTIWKDSFSCAVALIAFAVWFPMTMLTSSGIANVRLTYLDVARTLGAGRLFLIFRVAIPAATPNIFLGLFIGLVASFLTLIVAESVGVQAGLGWYLKWQKGDMEYAKAYSAILISAVFFSTLMTILFKVRDWVLRWQKGVIKW
jgi:NitT/TauT family transport system permease protein